MYRLDSFGLTDLLECSAALREAAAGASSMEEAADGIVRYLRDHLIDKETGDPSLELVRFYKTHPFELLEPSLQAFARAAVPGAAPMHGVPCLTLLASAGSEPAWNDRASSRSHRAIPLQSTEAIAQSPMIAELMHQLGIEAEQIVAPEPGLIRTLEQRTYGVFYEPEARGSPYVPAQNDFVLPYGIRSVLGFGGLLPTGDLFAVVMFSNTPIPSETADAFATIALSVKVGVLPFVGGRVFDSDPATDIDHPADHQLALLRSQVAALDQLLEVRGSAVAEQASRLQQALQFANDRAVELALSRSELADSQARKSAIVDGALDCIISMDHHGRVLEWNHAAETTFGFARDEAVGSNLADLIIPPSMRERHTRGLTTYLETGEGPVINRRIEVTALRSDGTELPVELSITPVADVNPPIFSGYLRDITERRRSDNELLSSRERLAHIAHTLQASLLPPLLPRVPRIELASAYRAAGEGNEVGGDFFDVFEVSDGRWALTLGDVCGKGPEAAALTGLVRYTMRAAAMRTRRPQIVLSELNQAIQRQHPESFCTAAFTVFDPKRLRLAVASGGHPPVLVVRATGELDLVRATGPLLGPFESWSGTVPAVQLHDDDIVVLYSDGVTEARVGRDFFGDERLHEAARSGYGSSAAEVVRRIESAVLEFAGTLSDDLAILAFQVTG